MKRVFYTLLVLLMLSACDKLILKVDGDDANLQGKWQQTPEDTVFFNFQKNLFQYQIYVEKDSMKQAYGYYTLNENKTIKLELLQEHSSFSLDHLGWNTIYSGNYQDTIYKIFHVDLINSKKMVLSSGNETLNFQKF
jgi:hypothetical protein